MDLMLVLAIYVLVTIFIHGFENGYGCNHLVSICLSIAYVPMYFYDLFVVDTPRHVATWTAPFHIVTLVIVITLGILAVDYYAGYLLGRVFKRE